MITQFISVGFHHIVALDALDHLLFLLALAACYRLRDWRHLLAVASAFTIGHSLTLALATLNLVQFPTALVEFLIPCTIVVAAAENLFDTRRPPRGWQRPALAGIFGLVHGAGFATTLRGLFDDSVVVPLLGFNVGIEIGQAVVLATMIAILTLGDRALRASMPVADGALRWRIRLTSLAAASAACVMAAGRAPW